MRRASSRPDLLAWPPRGGGWLVLAGAAIIVAALFGAAVYSWYLPNEPEAVWREVAIAALAFAAACVLYAVLFMLWLGRRHAPLLLPVLWAVAYTAAATLDLRVSPSGLALGGPRSYLYVPSDCGFAVRLPARPRVAVKPIVVAPGQIAATATATLADLSTATAYRVECVALASGVDADGLLALARDRAEIWAREGQLEVERIEMLPGPPPELRLSARSEGRDELNRPRAARMQARTVIGPVSMATIVASRLGGEPPDERVLASLAPRGD